MGAASLWVWLGALIVVAVLGGLGVMALRRRLLRGDGDAEGGVRSLMEELEQLRLSGKLSAEEFGRAKRRLADRAAGRVAEPPARPHGEARADGTLVARPGRDLAGDLLPGRFDDDTPPGP